MIIKEVLAYEAPDGTLHKTCEEVIRYTQNLGYENLTRVLVQATLFEDVGAEETDSDEDLVFALCRNIAHALGHNDPRGVLIEEALADYRKLLES